MESDPEMHACANAMAVGGGREAMGGGELHDTCWCGPTGDGAVRHTQLDRNVASPITAARDVLEVGLDIRTVRVLLCLCKQIEIYIT